MVNLALWKTERKLFRSIRTTEQLKRFVNDETARLDFVRKCVALLWKWWLDDSLTGTVQVPGPGQSALCHH